MKEIVLNSVNETIDLGEKIGNALFKGAVVLLDGDLGAGKTTFTKGIGKALGVKRTINSPTFTIMKIYDEGSYPLYHLDLYRLNGVGSDFDLEEYIDGEGIAVIEWPNQASDLLPSSFLKINIKRLGDEKRSFEIEATGQEYEKILDVL